jgi:acyl-coenzyme A thioesterase PaaI-like protein
MLTHLPMGLLAGLRIRTLNEQQTVVSVPFKYLNKNPFRSIYFAVQSMAAEMSTATACLLAVEGHTPTVAFIIVDLKANFTKKATGRVFFTCHENAKAFAAVASCIQTGEATQATFKTVGKMADGTVVSEFEFTWSFKQRTS